MTSVYWRLTGNYHVYHYYICTHTCNLVYFLVLDIYHNFVTHYYRPIGRIRGFTRETLIALTTNIESREHRRMEIAISQSLPENPRASTTDDVECFFSVLRDSTHTDKDFTLKTVYLS